ncbi:MAG: hypothetical protein LBM06_04805 [Prevotellaceae bacterium]|nr:hypothetical protein [Prevotellaceae bacterium]
MKTKVFLAMLAVAFSLSVTSCGGKKAANSENVDATKTEACCAGDSAKACCKNDSTKACCKGDSVKACCDSTKVEKK